MDLDIPDIDEVLICPHSKFGPVQTMSLGLHEPKVMRDYQKGALENYLAWRHNPEFKGNNTIPEREALVAISMGMGKTVIAAEAIKDEISHGGRVLWVTHRRELKTQCKNAIMGQTGIPAAYSMHQLKDEPVLITGNTIKDKTLGKMKKAFSPTLIVIDEAHHAYADTYRKIKQQYPNAKVLNLTATPYRADITDELELGTRLACINPSEGIAKGYLAPFKTVTKLTHDFSKVKMDGLDYNSAGLSRVMMSEEMLSTSTHAILEKCEGRRGLVYCCNKKHAQAMRECLEAKGLRAKIVTEDVPMREREEIYQKLADGEIDQVMNVNCLTEGFDLPPVDMISILRPTRNAALYVQMLGRGLRLSPETGKSECIVIDALDVSKTKGRKEAFDLPLEEELMRYRATVGKPVSGAALFLSWFDGREKGLPGLDSPEVVHAAVNGSSPLSGKDANLLNAVWDSKYLPETDMGGYAALAIGVGCNGIEHVRKVLMSKGYKFNPHGVEKQVLKDTPSSGREHNERARLGNARREKTPLKNLVLNLLDPEVDITTTLDKVSMVSQAPCILAQNGKAITPTQWVSKQVRWFKDLGTGLQYAWCIEGTKNGLIDRGFAVVSPKGRALWFQTIPMRMIAEDGKIELRPERAAEKCNTKNGESDSMGKFLPMNTARWERLAPAIKNTQPLAESPATPKQRWLLSKNLKLNRTQKANLNVTDKISTAMASYLLDQNGLDTREIMKHVRERLDVIDALADVVNLNKVLPVYNKAKLPATEDPVEIAKAMKVKMTNVATTQFVEPSRSILVGETLYYLAMDERGFSYRNEKGELLHS